MDIIVVMLKGTQRLSDQNGHHSCHAKGTQRLSDQNGHHSCHAKRD